MRELVFEISELREAQLTELLIDSGFTAFYFEKSDGKTFLKVYPDENEIPQCLADEFPVLSSDVDPASWNRTWIENYKGDELTQDIFVLPSGVNLPDKHYKTVIKIDPSDSFGDGHHPTTKLCGELLEHVISGAAATAVELSMLDAGTGSGILAIAAWSMGVRDIELFDYDPVSVEKAMKNLRLNGIEGPSPFVSDIYSYKTEKKYDIVTANLLSKIIEDNIDILKSILKPDGKLILSGISTLWTDGMKKIFDRKNLEVIEHKILEEWNGFVLIKQK